MKKVIKIIIVIALLFYLYIFITNKKHNDVPEPKPEEKVTYVNKITNSSSTTIKKEWQELIIEYLDIYAESLKKIEKKDLTHLFTEKDGIYAYLSDATLDLVIQDRLLLPHDMKMKNISYDIDYDDVEISDDKVTIVFKESDYFEFNFMEGVTSKVYDVENTIVISKNDDKYTIDSFKAVKDNYVMFTNVLDIEDSSKSEINELKQEYIDKKKDEIEENNEYLDEANNYKYEPDKECDNEYNREDAKKYAKKYANSRNSEYFDYSNLGGNCVNFVSQSIHAGGIPMDYEGDYQWKYYDEWLSDDNEPEGRSSSWTATGYFYRYAKNNRGYGMCAEVDVNPYYALAGDAFEVGYDGYTHGVIVVGQIKKDNKIVDIMINSNTVGLEDYPLSAYTYFNKRLIKVLGYND